MGALVAVSRLYLELVRALDARRKALGWSMARLDDEAGTQDGHFAKCLHADAPSGRQAQWQTLELFADALFRSGANVVLTPANRTRLPKPANDSAPVQLALDLDVAGQHVTLVRWRRKRQAPRGYRVRPRRRAA